MSCQGNSADDSGFPQLTCAWPSTARASTGLGGPAVGGDGDLDGRSAMSMLPRFNSQLSGRCLVSVRMSWIRTGLWIIIVGGKCGVSWDLRSRVQGSFAITNRGSIMLGQRPIVHSSLPHACTHHWSEQPPLQPGTACEFPPANRSPPVYPPVPTSRIRPWLREWTRPTANHSRMSIALHLVTDVVLKPCSVGSPPTHRQYFPGESVLRRWKLLTARITCST